MRMEGDVGRCGEMTRLHTVGLVVAEGVPAQALSKLACGVQPAVAALNVGGGEGATDTKRREHLCRTGGGGGSG